MCDQEGRLGWAYIVGNESCDRWVMISPDKRTLLIGEWESTEDGVKKTIRLASIPELD
jgi:hypothetical protein